MSDEMNDRSKREYLEAYLSRKGSEEGPSKEPRRAARGLDLPPLRTVPGKAGEDRGQRKVERLPIRELALKRAQKRLSSPGEGPEDDGDRTPEPGVRASGADTRIPMDRSHGHRGSRGRGFKLVRDGTDTRRAHTPSGRGDRRSPPRSRKRLSLYDLYAPRTGSPMETGEVEEEIPDGELTGSAPREEVTAPAGEAPVREDLMKRAEEETVPEPSPEEEDFREEAQDILFGTTGPKRRRKDPEAPILKEGPDRSEGRAPEKGEVDPGTMGEAGVGEDEEAGVGEDEEAGVGEDDSIMDAGTISVEEHRPSDQGMEESQPSVEGNGKCHLCGNQLAEFESPTECNLCGVTMCRDCKMYEMGHRFSNVYYDYRFEFPLCETCYNRSFEVQKQLARAQMCFGSGNLTYARYYIQNAMEIDKDEVYKERAEDLLRKIEKTREARETHRDNWKQKSKFITRSRFQDPAWGRRSG